MLILMQGKACNYVDHLLIFMQLEMDNKKLQLVRTYLDPGFWTLSFSICVLTENTINLELLGSTQHRPNLDQFLFHARCYSLSNHVIEKALI